MKKTDIAKVSSEQMIGEISTLANKIWSEHYCSILSSQQIVYMLRMFQSEQAISGQIENGYNYYLLYVNAKDPVGYLCVQVQNKQLFLSKFYLLQEYRGKGLGRKMMGFVEKLARDNKCSSIWLTVHKKNPSIKVYEKLGFNIEGPVLTDIGHGFIMDDQKMVKTIV